MKFGYTASLVHSSKGVSELNFERIIKGVTTKEIKLYCESIIVENDIEAHAEFLKLQDAHTQGRVKSYGIMCYTGDDGKIERIEKTWTI